MKKKIKKWFTILFDKLFKKALTAAFCVLLQPAEAKTRILNSNKIEKRSDGEGEMKDALKYLEELDKYYSQVARPRLFWIFYTSAYD